jgi:hypothetical protein
VIREDVDIGALLDRILQESNYAAKRDRFSRENSTSKIRRGVGLASFFHGAGFTGFSGGEAPCFGGRGRGDARRQGQSAYFEH